MLSRRRVLAAALAAPAILQSSVAFGQLARKIVIAQPSAGFIYLPVYVAHGLGLFRQEGLDVEIVVFDKGASSALTAVIGGDATLYVGLPAIPLQARAKGRRTTIFGSLFNQCGSEIVLRPEVAEKAKLVSSSPPTEKAASLRDLKIAVAGAGSITDLLVRHVAKFGGLDPERHLTIIPIGGGPNMLAAFAQRKIDGYCLSAPTSTIGAVTMGAFNLFDFSRGEYPPLRNFLYTAVSARDEWLASNDETATQIVRALWRAQIAMRARPDEAKASLRNWFPRLEAPVLQRAWDGILPGFGSSLETQAEGVQRNYEFLSEVRGTAISSPVNETFTNAFVEACRSTL